MRGAVIILSVMATMLVASVYAQDSCDAYDINPSGCGCVTNLLPPRSNHKVVGGTLASVGQIPYQVQLFSNGRFLCGGSIINSRFILTAAHCINPNTPTIYTVQGGHVVSSSTNEPSSTGRIGVIAAFNHPAYSSTTYKNDIAVLQLATPLTYTAQVAPICIPAQGSDYEPLNTIQSKRCRLSGFGTVSSGGALSTGLRYVDTPITGKLQCQAYYGGNYDPVTMICAAEINDGTDTCQGDSGGPMTYYDTDLAHANGCNWVEIGVVSWGYGCGDIGVYSRVSTYTTWIQGIIKGAIGGVCKKDSQ